jgi:hypothetical protein
VQVGTSRDSSVSGGADYPFTLTQTRKNYFSIVSPTAAGIHPCDKLDDPDQAGRTSMFAGCHRLTDLCEALEVESFPESSGYCSK